ncbi:MAG: AraC family transcriptional regulator [Hyphomicrobiales bacterium]|nr:AraC family transcriptional regulator [Hyphomicrobiales bacterium]
METEFILDEMEIAVDPFALCELNGRCDLGLGRDASATLHYVLAGQGEILLSGAAPIPLSRGSLVLVPAQRSHTLRSYGTRHDPVPTCRPAGLDIEHVIHPADGRTAEDGLIALCAHVSLSLRKVENLIDLIRTPVVETVHADSALAAPVHQLLREISNPGPGSRAMIRALLLQAMIELMRRRLASGDAGLSWMAALGDGRLWPALQRMLDAPGEPHSVESLAQIAGMSRSGFAKRFGEAYGSGPMELLRDLRMRLACSLLSETDLPVKRIAEMVGFTSRSAFSRSFEAVTGVSPRGFRRRPGAA